MHRYFTPPTRLQRAYVPDDCEEKCLGLRGGLIPQTLPSPPPPYCSESSPYHLPFARILPRTLPSPVCPALSPPGTPVHRVFSTLQSLATIRPTGLHGTD